MARKWLAVISVCSLVLGSAVYAAVDPAAKCKDAKGRAAGRKAFDLLKAHGSFQKKPNAQKLATSISKAQSKFTKAFSTAEETGGCQTVGDAPTLEAVIDSHVADILFSVNGCSTLGPEALELQGLDAWGEEILHAESLGYVSLQQAVLCEGAHGRTLTAVLRNPGASSPEDMVLLVYSSANRFSFLVKSDASGGTAIFNAVGGVLISSDERVTVVGSDGLPSSQTSAVRTNAVLPIDCTGLSCQQLFLAQIACRLLDLEHALTAVNGVRCLVAKTALLINALVAVPFPAAAASLGATGLHFVIACGEFLAELAAGAALSSSINCENCGPRPCTAAFPCAEPLGECHWGLCQPETPDASKQGEVCPFLVGDYPVCTGPNSPTIQSFVCLGTDCRQIQIDCRLGGADSVCVGGPGTAHCDTTTTTTTSTTTTTLPTCDLTGSYCGSWGDIQFGRYWRADIVHDGSAVTGTFTFSEFGFDFPYTITSGSGGCGGIQMTGQEAGGQVISISGAIAGDCINGTWCGSAGCGGFGACASDCTPSCDDGIACTVDSFVPGSGCSHAPDDSLCAGVGGYPATSCTRDACNPSVGCVGVPKPAGSSCVDNIACTISDSCDGTGFCQSAGPDDTLCAGVGGYPPTSCTRGACNPSVGCVGAPKPAGSGCDDNDSCTSPDACDGGGTCVGSDLCQPPSCVQGCAP